MSPATRGERVATRVRIPADVERDDRLLGNLTARQLAILGCAAVVLFLAYHATRHLLPPVVFAAVAFPFGALAGIIALGRAEGLSGDRIALAALRHVRSPRRLVPAPGGVPAMPAVLPIDPGPVPAPLRLPFVQLGSDGILDLGRDGVALVARASSITFSLRTPTEQEALVAGFARWLNGLAEPVELLVRAAPVDLARPIAALLEIAPGLPHPALERGAKEHAAFLAELGATRTLLRRDVLVVLRQPTGADAAERLRRRAEEATSGLAAAGVALCVLSGDDACAVLLDALDPDATTRPRQSASGAVVTSTPKGANR